MRKSSPNPKTTKQKSFVSFPVEHAEPVKSNKLYYGDNLENLRKYITDESVQLCYIDPPFNSKRTYNQIYNNIGSEDKAQAQAFIDTWTWDDAASYGFNEIVSNYRNLFTSQTINLIVGLEKILGKGSLLSYLIHMTLRIAEIHRILKSSGSFYLHCDSSSSHYLKLILDAQFLPTGGEFQNEIIWKRYAVHSLATAKFDAISDTIFFYAKDIDNNKFKLQYENLKKEDIDKRFPHIEKETGRRFQHASLEKNSNASSKNEIRKILGRKVATNLGWVWAQETFDERLGINPHLIYWTETGRPRYKIYLDEYAGKPIGNIWTDIPYLSSGDSERLGYPTQKPEALLERIIQTSSEEGDTILDAYCGCGTSVAVAERLNRNWIGMDITYQSISLILKRLEEHFGMSTIKNIILNGVPGDFKSAEALANKEDDKTRKEFEKWAVLTYSNNRAIINQKKGKDKGIDGIAFMVDFDETGKDCFREILFSVKSNKVLSPSVIRDLNGTIERDKAAIGILITLYPMNNLVKESKQYGMYRNEMLGQTYPKIQVISVEEILSGKTMKIPTSIEVLKEAAKRTNIKQQELQF